MRIRNKTRQGRLPRGGSGPVATSAASVGQSADSARLPLFKTTVSLMVENKRTTFAPIRVGFISSMKDIGRES